MNTRVVVSADRPVRPGTLLPGLVLLGILAATVGAAPPTDSGIGTPPTVPSDAATPTGNPTAPNTDQDGSPVNDSDTTDPFGRLQDSDNPADSARYKYSVRYTDGNRRKLETILASSEPLAYRKVRKKHPDADSILLVEIRKDGDRVDRRRRNPNSGRTIDGPLAGRQGGGNLEQSNQQERFLAAEMRRQRFAELDRAARLEWLKQWTFADDETRRRMSKQYKATQLAALRGLAAVPSKMRLAVLRILDRFKYSIILGTGKTGGQIKAEILRRGGTLIPKDPVSAFTENMDRMHAQNIQNILRGKTFQDINSRMQQAMIELQQRRLAAARAKQQASSGGSGQSGQSGKPKKEGRYGKGNTYRGRKKQIGNRVRPGQKNGGSGASGSTGGGKKQPGEGKSGVRQGSGIPVKPDF